MRLLLHRSFEVTAPREAVWEHLARPAGWPSWARHIKAVEVVPEGKVTASTVGTVHLANKVRSRFAVTEFREGDRWLWTGRFLWLHVNYDHVLHEVGPTRTRISFDVFVGGIGSRTLGRLFAWIYGRNLDRAIPNLVAELEQR